VRRTLRRRPGPYILTFHWTRQEGDFVIQLRTIVLATFLLLLGAPLAASAERLFCESRDYHRNYCPTGGPIGSVRLVVQQSQAPCIQGRTWGYDGNGIWVTQGCSGEFDYRWNRPPPPMPSPGARIDCDSRNYQQQFCPAGRRVARAWLVEQRSQAACIQGRTWGYQQDGIWVSGGCAGTFAVEGGGPPPGPPPINRVSCESRDYQQRFCPVGPSIARAWIVEQRSQATCTQGQTWGFQRNGIWVNAGCSGVFAYEAR